MDHLLTPEQRRVRDDAREYVNATPSSSSSTWTRRRSASRKEWLREAGRRNLLGVRHPVKWGGRGLDWVTSCAVTEEIGSLSYELACVLRRRRGSGVRRDRSCTAPTRRRSAT